MVLAIAALFVQFSALPQSSLATIPPAAVTETDATPPAADAAPVATPSFASSGPPSSESTPDVVLSASSEAPLDYIVAFQPGLLTPEPVSSSSAAPSATGLFSSSAGTAAFIASTPSAVHAERQERLRRHMWLGLTIAQHSAATFDAWSTRRVISSGQGQELNPMLRPFAGNASLYAAIQVGPVLFDFIGHRMMDSRHGWERHTWWVPQALGTAMSIMSGAHNLSLR
jgi:hypothetical protein